MRPAIKLVHQLSLKMEIYNAKVTVHKIIILKIIFDGFLANFHKNYNSAIFALDNNNLLSISIMHKFTQTQKQTIICN